ncbi:AAA family ATPase [Tessaracoccus flavescens]|uniref:AAA family ATPase n=1 Tax=Tessaracoccus flavescens TaxID=399497 RepID=UPI0013747898|nr:ATP-binding protein [Tessaracoccus flavescens]
MGRNGSGKSNVFDALAVLSSLGGGLNLRDSLDGGRNGPVVRGGSEGCAPIGEDSFSVGCAADIDGLIVHLDIEVQTSPNLQIRSERLWALRQSGPRKGEPQDFLKSEQPSTYSADITARWDNGKRGVNPGVTMRADQLLTSQVITRVPATSQAGRKVHEIAAEMLQAIAGIFLLDPVPHQMREYVPERDSVLRRTADNLSATVRRLADLPGVREILLSMTRSLSEAQVTELDTVTSELGDVMLTISERIGGEVRRVPARLMSDGTLRFLAIVAALLDDHDDAEPAQAPTDRTLAIEELENGLHPSQAALLLRLLKQSAAERKVSTVATTHSPAILNALDGQDHKNVLVCTRDEDGWSRVTRLVDFPDYFEVIARTSLGENAAKDRLRPSNRYNVRPSVSLSAILGD